ncbi:MAG: hypothetical protein L0Z55_11835 [Planctomycetes bacterium]|nr:hypothetical protein [Planctomycetota bacterium]
MNGPHFVGFAYEDEDLAGAWNVTLTGEGPAQGFIVVLSMEIDETAHVTGGMDSRGVDLTGGTFTFVDRNTGTLVFDLDFEDGSGLAGEGILEPGAKRISAGFISNFLLGGSLAARRTSGPSTFAAMDAAGDYDVVLVDSESGELREGEFSIDAEGEFLDASVAGMTADDGDFLLVNGETGLAQWDVFLPNGEVVVSVGFISLATGVIAGNYFSVTPQGNGFSLLTPIDIVPH